MVGKGRTTKKGVEIMRVYCKHCGETIREDIEGDGKTVQSYHDQCIRKGVIEKIQGLNGRYTRALNDVKASMAIVSDRIQQLQHELGEAKKETLNAITNLEVIQNAVKEKVDE